MRFDVLTLFPEMFGPMLDASILGRARASGRLDVQLHNWREFSTNKHKKVDDRPFGGGPGMVLACQPLIDCVESILTPEQFHSPRVRRILLAPAGRKLTQDLVRELATAERILLVCGHYEGFDERIRPLLHAEELSIGDYVLSGGEPAAMVVIDAVARLVPGVLGHSHGAEFESFDPGCGLLDYPVYTRPTEYRGLAVPEVLLSGDHQAIAQWRLEQSLARTAERRPDLLPDAAAGPAWAARMADVARLDRDVRRTKPPSQRDEESLPSPHAPPPDAPP